MDDVILSVRNLRVSYTGGRRKERTPILDDLSFEIRRGEILGLVGESGCGKSTLARAILGMIPKEDGVIFHASSGPQMVFQDPYGSLNPSKKIGWILEEPLKMRSKLGKEERQQKVEEMLVRIGLGAEYKERYPRELSGGQRQRIAIAAALMLSPQFLIADEPVSALDVTIQAQILELLAGLQKEMGISMLFISHDLRVVYQLCQRVMIMQGGRIVEEGPVDRVYASPQHAYTKELLEAAGITAEEMAAAEEDQGGVADAGTIISG